MASPVIRDGSWVRQAFLVKKAELDQSVNNSLLRSFSTNQLKFVDTRPGGALCINPLPQFTRFADPRPANGGRAIGSTGLGRYYSEAIDDNNQIIHMRFGMPSFNSLLTFFTGFYNSGASRLANTGRAGGFFYTLGRVIGAVIPIVFWKLLAVHMLGVAARFFMNKPSSKFYTLKPTMPVYYAAAQTILNQILVNNGTVPRIGGDDSAIKLNDGYEWTSADSKRMHDMLPDVFSESGQIDLFAMANRGQRLARKDQQRWKQMMDADVTSFNAMTSRVQSFYNEKLSDAGRRPFTTYLDQWTSTGQSSTAKGDTMGMTEALDKSTTGNTGILEFFEAELDDGAAFVSFRVNPTGAVQESFSNQTTQSEIQQTANDLSASRRSAFFNFANGNLADVPILNQVLGAAKDLTSGVLDSMQMSGLAVLGGAAFVDIPEHWQSSSAQLPRSSYTIDLVTPYPNNPVARAVKIFAPLALLLAGVLPKSTGKQSWTSPFLCELYDRGRNTTRLGIIDSMTISRGEGNLGWDNEGHFLNIKVTFTVKDLSSVLHMPITEGFTLNAAAEFAATGSMAGAVLGGLGGGAVGSVAGPAGTVIGGAGGAAAGGAIGAGVGGATGALVDIGTGAMTAIGSLFDDETVFTDYMSTLASVGLADLIYPSRRFKRNMTQLSAKWESMFSPAHFASFVGDFPPSQLLSAFYIGTIK